MINNTCMRFLFNQARRIVVCINYLVVKMSGLFDADWYVLTYPDVKTSGMSPLEHFIKIGYKRNYNPSPYFSCSRYLAAYSMPQGKNPLMHYLKKGRFHGYIRYSNCDVGKKKDQIITENPLISVIVTSYNYVQYISQTLDSVLSQSYKNFEIVVVDDGSEDDSVLVISEYVKKYRNVKLFQHQNHENRGLIASIMLGIEKSKGQYIAFCESDDYWAERNLERKIQVLNQYESVAIISNNIELIGNEKNIEQRQGYLESITRFLRNGGNQIDLKHSQEKNWIPTLSAVMIRSDILRKLNYDSPVPAWVDFWLYRQILKNYLLYYIEDKLTYWRQHDSYNGDDSIQMKEAKKNNVIFLAASNKLIGLNSKRIKVL